MDPEDPWTFKEQADIGVAQSLRNATRAYVAIGIDGTVPLYTILRRLALELNPTTHDQGRLVVRPGAVPPPQAKPPPAFIHAAAVPPKAPNVPAAPPPKAPNPPPAPPPARPPGRAPPIPNAPPPKAPNPPPSPPEAALIPKPPPPPPQAKQHPVGQVRQYPGPPAGAMPGAPGYHIPAPPDVFTRQRPEDYFRQLPSFAYTVDEKRLRDAVVMFLRQWPHQDPPTRRDVEIDPFAIGVIGDCHGSRRCKIGSGTAADATCSFAEDRNVATRRCTA